VGRQSAATGAISLNRFWNAIVSFAVSVEIRLARGFIRNGWADAAENSAMPDEGIVSAGLYFGCKRGQPAGWPKNNLFTFG
jgi:hypothetical protein